MTEAQSYKLQPTKLIPNSPWPLLHYPRFFSGPTLDTLAVHKKFLSNGWDTQWVVRYGPMQRSHYHSQTHECMAVLSGTATIRFGIADTDTDSDPGKSQRAAGMEDGGIEVRAEPGDVFVIPAGVAHKTYDAAPTVAAAAGGFLTPGDGHGIAGPDPGRVLRDMQLSGFTMIGAYPRGFTWDSCEGGEHVGRYEAVWSVPKPGLDPVMGEEGGLLRLWT